MARPDAELKARMGRPGREVEPYHLDEINTFYRAASGRTGFQLIIAEYNDPAYRDMLIERMNDAVGETSTLLLSADACPTFDSFERRLRSLCREYKLVHLAGLDTWLYMGQNDEMIRGFNYHREGIAQGCPSTMVLWMTGPDIKAFALGAPDMWAWRSAVFAFNVEDRKAAVLEPQPQRAIEGFTLESRLKRIAEIKDYLKNAETQPPKQIYGNLLSELGILYYGIGKYDEALDHYNQALAIHREIGHRQGKASDLGNIGNIYYALGRMDEALDHLNQALIIDRELGDRRGEATQLGNIGNIYYTLGRMDEALDHHNQALAIDREISYRQGEATQLGNIGNIYYALGRMDKALDHLNQALIIDREIGYRQGEAEDLGNIGIIYRALGRMDEALDHYNQALAIDHEIGYRQGEAAALGNIGVIYGDLGRMEEALDHLNQALIIDREIGYRQGEAAQFSNIGIIYGALGRIDEALDHYNQALAIHREIGYRQGEAAALGNIGNIYGALGRMEETLDHYNQALAIFKEIGAAHMVKHMERLIEAANKGRA